MGLKEKQAINDIIEKDIPKYEKRLKDAGLTINFKVDWDTIPQTSSDPVARCKTILNEFTMRIWDFSQDKTAKAEVEKNVKSVRVTHDANQTGEYDYKVKLNGDCFDFTANLDKFTFTQSSKQKNLRETLEGLL